MCLETLTNKASSIVFYLVGQEIVASVKTVKAQRFSDDILSRFFFLLLVNKEDEFHPA
jgi:hypothetical protein